MEDELIFIVFLKINKKFDSGIGGFSVKYVTWSIKNIFTINIPL